MNVTVENANDGEIVVFKLTNYMYGEKEYKCILNNSKADLHLSKEWRGFIYISATYLGNDYRQTSTNTTYFVFSNAEIIPAIHSLSKYYNGDEKLEIIFKDGDVPIYNATADIYINGVKYTRSSDTNGIISMNINLKSGNYGGWLDYEGEVYGFTIKIKPTVYGEDVTADYNAAVKYTAHFLDSTGKALTEGIGTFKINSQTYYSTISDGVASISVPKDHGSYMVEVTNPLTGETNFNYITIQPIKTVTRLSGVKNINVGDSLFLTANVNVDVGAVLFSINSSNITVDVFNKKASCIFWNLEPGNYVAKAIYMGPGGNYLSSSDSSSFNVFKRSSDISVTADDIGAGQNAVFEVTLDNSATGDVSIIINNKTYKNQLCNDKSIISIPDLDIGSYAYDVVYDGDDSYNSKSVSGNVRVSLVNVVLNVSDLIKYYSSSKPLAAQLLDKSGNPLTGQKIIFTVNNKDYERTTDDSGIASMNINLNSGNYTAGVSFGGNGIYDSIKTLVQIEIKPTVEAKDFSKIFKNDTQYYASFLDSKGNLLKNTTVQFNINGVFYNRTIDEKGIARMNINLNPGKYVLTAVNPSTGEYHATTITVLSSIVEANNLTKYYKNEQKYTLKILDDYGNAAGEGVAVKLNINGVFYERKTNSSGYINMNINLAPGSYVITAEYNGLRASNTITVLPILEAKDIQMNYMDGSKFKVKLLDGKGNPFANQFVTFNINGILYKRLTDDEGIAGLNINLMVGKYIITSSYNGANIANTITITA